MPRARLAIPTTSNPLESDRSLLASPAPPRVNTGEIETSQFVEVLISGSQSAHAGELREISAGQILIGQRNQQPTTLKPDGSWNVVVTLR